MEKMMTRKEFADALRVCEKTVSRWVREGKVKCRNGGDGSRYRIPESQIKECMEAVK